MSNSVAKSIQLGPPTPDTWDPDEKVIWKDIPQIRRDFSAFKCLVIKISSTKKIDPISILVRLQHDSYGDAHECALRKIPILITPEINTISINLAEFEKANEEIEKTNEKNNFNLKNIKRISFHYGEEIWKYRNSGPLYPLNEKPVTIMNISLTTKQELFSDKNPSNNFGYESGLLVKEPQPILKKTIRIVNKKKFLENTLNLLKHIVKHEWNQLFIDITDIVKTFGLGNNVSEAAWRLISRALNNALMSLLEETNLIITEDTEKKVTTLVHDTLKERGELKISSDFFKNPQGIKLIHDIKPVFLDFLKSCDFEESINRNNMTSEEKNVYANNVSNRIPRYFVVSLIEEWRTHSKDYIELERALRTPFDENQKKQMAWLFYSLWLNKEVERPLFAESFSLSQVYVPLRAYFERDEREEGESEKVVVDLKKELNNWLWKTASGDDIRIICGGPGCGKSSFLKIFAAQQANSENVKVLFIPLHLFKIEGDLIESIKKFVQNDQYLSSTEAFNDKPLLIIFDGLDELAMEGKISFEMAYQFIRDIKAEVSRRNHQAEAWKVLISGRDIIIQANKKEFRKLKQILNIIPYCVHDKESAEYCDPNKLLYDDQRNIWWKKYGQLKGKDYPGLPEKLKTIELADITSQPLLNYLVARSYEDKRITFSKDTNLNQLYDDFFKAVYERIWEKRQHRITAIIPFNSYKRIFEDIAVSCWHGAKRTANVKEIEGHLTDADSKHLFEILKNDTRKESKKEKALISLLLMFFCRQASINDSRFEETFEFTHKSFEKYLTASRLWRKIKKLNTKYTANCGPEAEREDVWNIDECLLEWVKFFGPTEIDNYLFKFVCNEIKLELERGTSKNDDLNALCAIQETLKSLVNIMLTKGLPMEKLPGNLSYAEQNRRAINAEKALLIMLSCIATFTNKISCINWQRKTGFGDLLSRLVGQRIMDNIFILKHLNHLNLEGQDLSRRDFSGADFTGANLNGADFTGTNLKRANLQNTTLQKTIFTEANLKEVNLKDTGLDKTNFIGANLIGAYPKQTVLNDIIENTNVNSEGAKYEDDKIDQSRLLLALREINKEITKTIKYDQELNEILEKVTDQMGFNFAAISLVNRYDKTIEMVRGKNVSSGWIKRAKHLLDSNDISAWIVKNNESQLIKGNDTHKRFDEEIFKKFGHDQFMRFFVPLTDSDGQAVGTIEAGCYIDDATNIMTDENMQAIKKFGQEKGNTIAASSPQTILELIAEHAMDIINADSASLYIYQEEDQDSVDSFNKPMLSAGAGKGIMDFMSQYSPRTKGTGWQAITEKRPIIIEDPEKLRTKHRQIFDSGIKSLGAFPLSLGEKINGVLYTHFYNKHEFTNSEIEIINTFTAQIAAAIQNFIQIKYITKTSSELCTLTNLQNVILSLVVDSKKDNVLQDFTDKILCMLDADNVTLYPYLVEKGDFVTPPIMAGEFQYPDSMHTQINQDDIVRKMLITRRSKFVDNIISEDDFSGERTDGIKRSRFVEREGIQSCAVLVLQTLNPKEIVGLLFVNYRSKKKFALEERNAMHALALSAAILIKTTFCLKNK